jgi:hypothetical protein
LWAYGGAAGKAYNGGVGPRVVKMRGEVFQRQDDKCQCQDDKNCSASSIIKIPDQANKQTKTNKNKIKIKKAFGSIVGVRRGAAGTGARRAALGGV